MGSVHECSHCGSAESVVDSHQFGEPVCLPCHLITGVPFGDPAGSSLEFRVTDSTGSAVTDRPGLAEYHLNAGRKVERRVVSPWIVVPS